MIKKRLLLFVILLIVFSSIVQSFSPAQTSILINQQTILRIRLQKIFNDYQSPEININILPKYMLDGSTALIKFKTFDKKTKIISFNARLILKNKIKEIKLFDDGWHSDDNANDFIITGQLKTTNFDFEKNVTIEITATDQAFNIKKLRKNIEMLPRRTCEQIVYNGKIDDKLDLLIMGDKYNNFTLMTQDLNKSFQNIIAFEPFKSEQKKINTFFLDSTNIDLECHYNCDNITRAMCCNDEKVLTLASQCPNDIIGVLTNTTQYGGRYMWSGYWISYKDGYKDNVVVHEVGHAFNLMDEYDYQQQMPQGFKPWGPNCETSSSCLSWSGTSGTGCFRSCTYSSLFRPIERNSMMLDHNGDFGPVNQKHLNNMLTNYK